MPEPSTTQPEKKPEPRAGVPGVRVQHPRVPEGQSRPEEEVTRFGTQSPAIDRRARLRWFSDGA